MTNKVQNLTIISVDGVLGIRTRDRRTVYADESIAGPRNINCLLFPQKFDSFKELAMRTYFLFNKVYGPRLKKD